MDHAFRRTSRWVEGQEILPGLYWIASVGSLLFNIKRFKGLADESPLTWQTWTAVVAGVVEALTEEGHEVKRLVVEWDGCFPLPVEWGPSPVVQPKKGVS